MRSSGKKKSQCRCKKLMKVNSAQDPVCPCGKFPRPNFREQPIF